MSVVKTNRGDIALLGVFLLVSLGSFGLGRLSALRAYKPQISVEKSPESGGDFLFENNEKNPKNLEGQIISSTSLSESEGKGEKLFVASKSGTRYYFPWCSGVSRIKEENKVWFATADEAKRAGYLPASNCKGL